jgi:hypothetical protein
LNQGLHTAVVRRRLNEEVLRAERYGHFLSVLVLHVMNGDSESAGFVGAFSILRSVMRADLRRTDHLQETRSGVLFFILPETPEEGALVVARRMQEHVGPYRVSGSGREASCQLQSRALITSYPVDGSSGDELLDNVDVLGSLVRHHGEEEIYIYSECGDAGSPR